MSPGFMLSNHSIQPFKRVQFCSAGRASSVIVCFINVFHLPDMIMTSCDTRFAYLLGCCLDFTMASVLTLCTE